MRDFIKRALKKLPKMTAEQTQDLLISAATEIDRLETVLDSLAQGILVCDPNHNLVLANKYAERFLPITHHDQGDEPLWSVVREEGVAAFLETTLLTGDRVEDREFAVEVKGIERLLSISVLPLVRDHQVSGSLIYIEDITEKRSKAAQLRRMESLASLTTLAAGVAHEIKNPLGSLSIHIQLIQKTLAAQGPGHALLDTYLGVVNEEIDRLNHIVVDFLFAVRPMNMDLHEGNLNTLIEELTGFVSFELEAAHITCTLDLAVQLPLIEFDERCMKQALLNLIKNAITAMPQGGALSIKTEAQDTALSISITDTGSGIPEAHLSKIFEPYFTTTETGSGLGLTLVYKIIREHQGEITVKSREGTGACFRILLPIPQKERRLISYGGPHGH
ncbi:MAG: ATP-binding protein [Treponema sp.]|jgi:PAS domain S-box-containing protein|nr:ATP-binding protein [Treponema sp.]